MIPIESSAGPRIRHRRRRGHAAVRRRSRHANDDSISRQLTKGRQGHAPSAQSKTRPLLSSPATTRTPVASPDTTRSRLLLPVTASAAQCSQGKTGAFTALRHYQFNFGASRTFHAVESRASVGKCQVFYLKFDIAVCTPHAEFIRSRRSHRRPRAASVGLHPWIPSGKQLRY